MKHFLRSLLAVLAIMPLLLASSQAQELQQKRFAVGNGGFLNQSTSTGGPSGGLVMSGTIGQTAVGNLDAAGLVEGERYNLYQGFWLKEVVFTSVENNNIEENSGLTNYPNPFSNQTNIRFNLDNPSYVTLKIYDMTGNLITELENSTMLSNGQHEVTWDGKTASGIDANSGTYMYELTIQPTGAGSAKSYALRNFMMLVK